MNPNKWRTIYLDNLLLPDYATLIENTQPNASENLTLNDTLYVDFVNRRRNWVISWQNLTVDQYDSIKAKFDKQFATANMLTLNIENLGVAVPVYITINDKNIKFNGQYIQGFSITCKEQYAIS